MFDQWPTEFSVVAERRWTMQIGPRSTVMAVSYVETNLSALQRANFISFITNQENQKMHEWLASVTARFENGVLTRDWIKEQEFCKNLLLFCEIQISGVFNFPCETPEIPESEYPLAFVLESA